MTTRNLANLPEIKHSNLPMAKYDTLPSAVRRELQNAPYNLSINSAWIDTISYDGGEIVAEIRRVIPDLVRSAALDAYGPDHPQAR